jgi:SHS2 domain-containing protein
VAGEPFDPARHGIEHQVKALTRHGFVFRPTAAGYHVEMVLDL